MFKMEERVSASATASTTNVTSFLQDCTNSLLQTDGLSLQLHMIQTELQSLNKSNPGTSILLFQSLSEQWK
jgi:hypothetical protein